MTNEKINMKENYTETIKVETDEEGNILVECRECAKEFKILYEFITAENPRIVCPHFNKEQSKVNLTKKDREKALQQALPALNEEFLKDIKKSFKLSLIHISEPTRLGMIS